MNMREILFRGKRINSGEWAYGDLLTCDDEMEIYSESHGENGGWVIPGTVGEYTGLTDKNGVKIFEGDIIRRKRIDGNWYSYEVFWWENCWGIKGGAEVALLILPLCGLQVIGNIHDNPELLGGDTNA